jgi:signal transduction histidine kinase
MDYLNCNWDTARFLVFSENVFDPLIYYSHFISLIPSLIVGIFVLWMGKRGPIERMLFFLTISFSLWVFFDLILWATDKIPYTMFFWSIMAPLEFLIYSIAFRLTYLFVNEKDFSFLMKSLLAFFFVPIILLTATDYNLTYYDLTNCDRNAVEGPLWTYVYAIEFVILLMLIVVSIINYRHVPQVRKRQVEIFLFGISLFLLLFSTGNFLIFLDIDWRLEQYKLFGMPIFIVILAHLIIKYKAFNAKLLGTQALVVALILLIGSQFFFVKTKIGFALAAVTFTLVVIAGIMLIRLFKRDEERKQQLQYMADSLAVANDQLRKLDNAKSEFISIASHQLRTPLTAIKGYISLLMEGSYGKVDPSVFDVLNKVYTSNERLIQLVENLLNISRMESGRMQYHFEPTQIEEIIRDLYDTFVIVAKNKKLFIKIDLPDRPLPKLMLDSQKMHEVLSNLIDNGLKYTQEGGVTLTAEEDKDVVRVTVADTGIGIPATEIPHLFTKFSRGKDVSRLHANGTGLGLYVVKNIIEAHHGKIWIESEGEGKGSRFVIELPKE